jgi:ubiquinone/menaquinone biosynthesis C-methylase UbiE
MGKKFDPRKKELLIAREREEQLHPHDLLRSFGLRAGDTIADIGCGPGFFTIPAAEIVGPSGKVYAADVQSEMIAAIMMRVADLDIHHVEILKTSETDVALPEHSVQMVWLAFVLHEMDQRAVYLYRLRRALRPDGRIVILEWEKKPTEAGPPVNERLTPEDVLSDAKAAGYKVVEHRQITPDQYAFVLAPM